jgi:carboxypeptidase family protein/TonB-dependent receptor-like protein
MRTMESRALYVLPVVVLLAGLASAPALAQERIPLTGIIQDQTDAIVPGAVAVLVNRATGEVREAVADNTGRFRFDVPPAKYSLLGRADDLQSDEKSVTMTTEPVEVKIRLKVGLEEEVTVTAGNPVSPEKNADALPFSEQLLTQLPLDSQNFIPLISSFLSSAALGDQGPSVVVDGVESDAFDVPTWAVRDASTNRNPYSAEFRRPGKSRIEITTKKASARRFRGDLALFARDWRFDETDAFAPIKSPHDRRLMEGGLSGPLPFPHGSFLFNATRLVDNGVAVVNARTLQGLVTANVPTRQERTNVIGRADFRAGHASTMTVFYTLFDEELTGQGVGGFNLPDRQMISTRRAHRVQVARQTIEPTLMNDLRLTIRHGADGSGGPAASPSIVVNGAFASGQASTFFRERETTIELADTAVYSKGPHTFHAGARLHPRHISAFDASNFMGTFRFSGLSAFEARTPYTFRVNRGQPDVSLTDHEMSAHAQDEIRVRSNLSVMAGVRYDWQSLIESNRNVSPRLSVAFAPVNQQTVFRAGAGVFYDRLPDGAYRRSLLFGGDRLIETVVSDPPYQFPLPVMVMDQPPSVVRLAPGLGAPYLVDEGASVERALWKGTQLTVAVDWLRGTHLFRSRNVNAPLPGTGIKPDAAFANITQIEGSGSMRSRSLTFTLRSRAGKRFEATGQYTWSRTINDVSGIYQLPADNYNLSAEWGRADFDRRHQVTGAGIFNLPRAFKVATLFTLASGIPFDITTGADDNGDSVANDRPAGVMRNTGKGPGLARVDLRVGRVFRLPSPLKRERQPRNFDVYLDAFNVLNRTNFVNFVGVQTSPFFGRANAALPPRTIQLSARYHF